MKIILLQKEFWIINYEIKLNRITSKQIYEFFQLPLKNNIFCQKNYFILLSLKQKKN
jgi:hypothetical protein